MSRALLIIVALASAGVVASTGFSQDLPDTTEPVTRLPGSWKTDVTFKSLEIPGAPPEMKSILETMMKVAQADEICYTPEQAAKAENFSNFMKTASDDESCTYSRQEFKGKNIDIEGVCKQGDDVTNVKVAGTQDPKQIDVLISTNGTTPKGPSRMEMNIVSTWTGECKPGQKTADDKPVT